MYYHCTAGADRTGTVSYILHAFLGVSELECHQDFAFTSFSVYGVRGSQSGRGANAERYLAMVALLKEYAGETLQEKAQNYLLSIGVTEAELENLKGIFFGDVEIPGAKTYNPNKQNTPAPAAKARMNSQAREVIAEDGYATYTITAVNVQPSGSSAKLTRWRTCPIKTISILRPKMRNCASPWIVGTTRFWYDDKKKKFCLIIKDDVKNGAYGVTGEWGSGFYAESTDCMDFEIPDDPKVYSRTIEWTDGRRTTQGNLERPSVLFDEKGKPTHIFCASGFAQTPYDFKDNTFIVCMKLEKTL